jgi:iron complex outermembrane receptor protein
LVFALGVLTENSGNSQMPSGVENMTVVESQSPIPRLPDVDVVAPTFEVPEYGFSRPNDAENLNRFPMSPFRSPPTVGYSAPSATTGMLVDTPILSIPQSIGIVSESLLQDQQLFSVGDAFRNVSGVRSEHSAGSDTANGQEFGYLIRGFPTTYRRWNGYRSDLIQTSIDTGNIERIEFIKGPASTLYGASDAGGFLNIITKKPQQDNFSRMSVSAGSWGLARTNIDVNRQLHEDVGFRINVGLQQKDSFRNFVNDDRILVAPVVNLRLTERTQILLEGEYYSTNTMYDIGTASIGGSLNALPISRLLMDPTDFVFGDYYKGAATLQHAISDDWNAQFGCSFGNAQQQLQTHFPFDRVGATIVQIPTSQTNHGRLPTVFGSLAGRFETGPFVHNFATNFELEWIETNTQTEFFFGAPYLLNATNPVYAGTFPPSVSPGSRSSQVHAQVASVQDRIELNDYFEVVAGTSYQNFDRILAANGTFTGAGTDNSHAFTPRGSLLFHPIPNLLSTWYSYSESLFVPSFFYPDANGNPIAPTAGRQHELGLRVTPSSRWWASAALFSLEKTSVPLASPLQFIVPVGARSQGVEFDLYGTLTDRLSVTANYAYLDTRITNDPLALGLQGKQMPLVPHNSANSWLRYNLLDDVMSGQCGRRRVVGVGNGLRWVGSSQTLVYPQYATFGGQVTMPSYVTWDTALFSEIGRWFANVYFENMTNARYYTSGLGAFTNPGNPFTVRATIGVAF